MPRDIAAIVLHPDRYLSALKPGELWDEKLFLSNENSKLVSAMQGRAKSSSKLVSEFIKFCPP